MKMLTGRLETRLRKVTRLSSSAPKAQRSHPGRDCAPPLTYILTKASYHAQSNTALHVQDGSQQCLQRSDPTLLCRRTSPFLPHPLPHRSILNHHQPTETLTKRWQSLPRHVRPLPIGPEQDNEAKQLRGAPATSRPRPRPLAQNTNRHGHRTRLVGFLPTDSYADGHSRGNGCARTRVDRQGIEGQGLG